MKVYLSGSVEKAKDCGVKWRSHLIKWLDKNKIEYVNPLELSDHNDNLYFKNKSNKNNHKIYKQMINKLMDKQLLRLMECDTVLVFFDKNIKKYSSGTHGEVTLGYFNKKRIYLVLDKNIKQNEVHGWLLGCATHVFKNMDKFKQHIKTLEYLND